MDLKGKRLLLLGGSSWKDAIKDFADEHKVVLIATGNDKSAGIFDIADEGYQVDSTNPSSMKNLILSKNIDGVYMGGSEAVISSACEYLEELDMPCYCTKKQWDFIQNKAKLKKLLSEFGLPVVFRYNFKLEDLDNTSEIDFPVITKPADSCGSSGFSVCNNPTELKKGYLTALKDSRSGEVLIEKFVNNDSIVAFYTFTNGKPVFSGLENKYPMKYAEGGSYVAGMHIFESHLAAEFKEKFDAKLQKMFRYLDINEGTIWFEIFYTDGEYYFNEAGFRYSGSVTVYPVDYFYNINQVSSDIYYALTGKSKISGWNSLIPSDLNRKKHYCIYPIYVKSGTIGTISGLDEIEKLDVTLKIIITKSVGDTVPASGDFFQNLGFIHFVFDTLDEFKAVVRKIDNLLKIQNTENIDMKIIHDDEFLNKITV